MGSGEVLFPELLQHVREHEQEQQGHCVLWKGWWMSGLAHQAGLDWRCQSAIAYPTGCRCERYTSLHEVRSP
jgi:hypothetical protein